MLLHLSLLFSCANALHLTNILHKSTSEFHASFQSKSIQQTASSQRSLKLKQGLLPNDMNSFFEVPQVFPSHSFTGQKVQRISETFVEARIPDMRDIDTLRAFGWMAFDSYKNEDGGKWVPVDGYNMTDKFGWKDDGIRGYIFYDDKSDIVVIVFKGTSTSIFGVGGGQTSAHDKHNDNMMFSCCCASVDGSWKPLCDCQKKQSRISGIFGDPVLNQCSQECLAGELRNMQDSYFIIANEIFNHVKGIYPTSSIFLTGHSLGGSLASLVGLKNGVFSVTFEAPGERLFAERMGLVPSRYNKPDRLTQNQWEKLLDLKLSQLPIYHFGNSRDPIFIGECTGIRSACYFAGYAMESKCHTGSMCMHDFEAESDAFSTEIDVWYSHINYHRVKYLVALLDSIDKVPRCKVETKCKDCGSWEFPLV